MAHGLMRSAALALAIGLALGCGGDRASEAADPAAVPGTADPAASAPPASATLPAPEVQLSWLPGGALAVENADTRPVSLARELTLQAGEGSDPQQLQLGLDCAAAPSTPTVAQGDAACLTLVPGAALAIGRWPDAHGACRCPPCVQAPAQGSFVIHTCDRGHAISRSFPER